MMRSTAPKLLTLLEQEEDKGLATFMRSTRCTLLVARSAWSGWSAWSTQSQHCQLSLSHLLSSSVHNCPRHISHANNKQRFELDSSSHHWLAPIHLDHLDHSQYAKEPVVLPTGYCLLPAVLGAFCATSQFEVTFAYCMQIALGWREGRERKGSWDWEGSPSWYWQWR